MFDNSSGNSRRFAEQSARLCEWRDAALYFALWIHRRCGLLNANSPSYTILPGPRLCSMEHRNVLRERGEIVIHADSTLRVGSSCQPAAQGKPDPVPNSITMAVKAIIPPRLSFWQSNRISACQECLLVVLHNTPSLSHPAIRHSMLGCRCCLGRLRPSSRPVL